ARSRSQRGRPNRTSTRRSPRRTGRSRSRSSRSRPASTPRRRARGSPRQAARSGRPSESRPMSWAEAELREQPDALDRFLEAEQGNAVALARELVQADVRYLLIASRGSSGNAARYAQYLFAAANRLPTAFATPSV